ncbi:MAG: hypothetical protein EA415_11365 [Sphaerobacteraceae bacterium]|nr:MAG: hypothetical protein EA415_11365 [Sphaerobacteraceae bacterium]
MHDSMLKGRNALINLFLIGIVIVLVFNAARGRESDEQPRIYQIPDRSDELRLSAPMSASTYVEVDGSPYLLLLSKADNERIETADLRIISVDPDEDIEQAGWIHTSMSIQRPPEALTYANGHVYVGMTREGIERPALWVVDLSNPNRPFEANLLNAEMPIRSLAASEDGWMVASGFDDDLIIYDIQQGNQPEQIGSFKVPVEMPPTLSAVGSTLLVEHSAGVFTYDMHTADSPQLIDSYDRAGWEQPEFVPTPDQFLLGNEGFTRNLPGRAILDVERNGEIIAFANGDDGVLLIEAPEQDMIDEISSMTLDGRVVSVSLDGDVAVALSARLSQGNQVRFAVHKLDISEPGQPRLLESSQAIAGPPRYQNVIARDGNIWILLNSTVYRFQSAESSTSP